MYLLQTINALGRFETNTNFEEPAPHFDANHILLSFNYLIKSYDSILRKQVR